MEEIWKNIEGFENLYQVSSYGRVMNYKTKNILKIDVRTTICTFRFQIDNKRYNFQLPKVVLKTFNPDILEKDYVIYKDGDKANNNLTNLEWAYFNPHIEKYDIVEIWKPVEGFEEYYKISNTGRLYSFINERYLQGKVSKNERNNYRFVDLHDTITGKHKRTALHNLVANHFIPNPENKPFPNHIDGIKWNNHIKNLEWATVSENNQHAWDIGLKETKSVYEVDVNGKIINNFRSMVEVSEKLGVSRSMVTYACNGKIASANGHYLVLQKEYTDNYKPKKRFEQYNLEGKLLNTFDSISEATKSSGLAFSAIYRSCNSEVKNPKNIFGNMQNKKGDTIMKFVDYVCTKCGTKQEITLESIHTEKPKEVDCIKEGCDGKAIYDIGELAGSMTLIPLHMQALSGDSLKYNKIPRDKKRFH